MNVTATTSGVDRIYQQMLKWNAQWRLDVDIANVTAIEQPTPEKVGRRLADLMLGVLHGTDFERLQTEWQPVLCAGNSDGPAPG